MVVFNKISFNGFKCFIGYNDGKNIKSLCIFPPKMSVYRRDFDETKSMSLIKLLEKYNEIWEKVDNSIKKRIWYWTCIK